MLYREPVGYEVDRLEFQIGDDRVMYIAKKAYEKTMKKLDVTSLYVKEGIIPRLIIEFRTKTGIGKMQLIDIGPRPAKPVRPKKEPKNIKR